MVERERAGSGEITLEMLVPLPVEMLKELDFTEIAIYLVHRGRPVLYKNKGVPVSEDFIIELYDRLQNFYIAREDSFLLLGEIEKNLKESFSKDPSPENMKRIFTQMSKVVDVVLALPTKENLGVMEQFSLDLSDYMEKNPSAAYLVAFTVNKDFTTTLHITNVGALVSGFAYHLGFREESYRDIVTAAFLHDVGKVKIPDNILKKPGKLSLREFELMKLHTLWGAKVLEENGLSRYSHVAKYHHERIDGSGYPEGLAGGKIPIEAQIVQVCDVYEALTGVRPYRDPLSPFDALAVMRDEFVLKGKMDKSLYKEFLTFLYKNRYDVV